MPRSATAAPRVVAAERRFRSRRRARRRRAIRPALVLAILVTFVAAAIWIAFASPLLTVTRVTVNGTSRLSERDVVTAAKVPIGSSLLTIPVESIKRRVGALPAVARVAVQRRWPHTVVITVTERVAAAVAVSASGDQLLDRTGFAFAAVASPPAGLPVVSINQPMPGAGEFAAAAAVQVWTSLPTSLRAQVTGLQAGSPDDVELHLTGGRVVVWGSADQAAAKLTALTALLAQRAHVYDVSTPTVAVTRG